MSAVFCSFSNDGKRLPAFFSLALSGAELAAANPSTFLHKCISYTVAVGLTVFCGSLISCLNLMCFNHQSCCHMIDSTCISVSLGRSAEVQNSVIIIEQPRKDVFAYCASVS